MKLRWNRFYCRTTDWESVASRRPFAPFDPLTAAMTAAHSQSLLIAISFILHLYSANCDNPDICSGDYVDSAERVVFNDDIEMLFITSGKHYWFINETSDQPSGDSAQELPYGFAADATLIKDTRQCNGHYSLLLIQVSHSLAIPLWSDSSRVRGWVGPTLKLFQGLLKAKMIASNYMFAIRLCVCDEHQIGIGSQPPRC